MSSSSAASHADRCSRRLEGQQRRHALGRSNPKQPVPDTRKTRHEPGCFNAARNTDGSVRSHTAALLIVSPFALGYTKSQGSPHQMGFGVRGNHTAAKTVNFGPALASLYLTERMMGLMRDVLAYVVPFVTLVAVAQSVSHGPLPSQPYQFSVISQAGVPRPECTPA